MASIAVVGLGAMGSRIATRLIDHGHDVAVWNRTEEKTIPLVELGAAAHASPREAAGAAETVMTMVADPTALRDVTEGTDGVVAGLQPNATLFEMSTVGPEPIARLAAAMPESTTLIDAPVLGSIDAVEAGTLKIFVGATPGDFERRRPLLEILGEPLRVGPQGTAAAAKLVANLTLIATLGILGEAIALAEGLGLDRATTFEILGATPIAAQAERRKTAMQEGTFPRRFALSLALKDAELVATAAAEASVELRVAKAAGTWFADATAESWGELDYSSILARIAGDAKPTG